MCNDPSYDSTEYSTFVRTKIQVELPKLSRGLAMLLWKFNWSQVAILYENSTYYTSIKDKVVEQFENEGINVRLERRLLTFGYGLRFRTFPLVRLNPLALQRLISHKETLRLLPYSYRCHKMSLDTKFNYNPNQAVLIEVLRF